MKRITFLFVSLFSICVFAEVTRKDYANAMIKELKDAPEQPTQEVEKSKEEWKKDLSEVEFHVLRNAGTEPPNGNIYKQFKAQGDGEYYCAGCGAKLFDSSQKFDSGSGWPSFFDGTLKNIRLDEDYHLGYKRVEIRCNKCDGHLGHVFEGEGYKTPTDKRYCVNGVCLTFLPKDTEEK